MGIYSAYIGVVEKTMETAIECLGFIGLGAPPSSVLVTIRDTGNSIRVLLYSYYMWWGPPKV